jgi:hypothetical protein
MIIYFLHRFVEEGPPYHPPSGPYLQLLVTVVANVAAFF